MECMDEILEYTIYSITCINERVKGIYVGSTKDFTNRQKEHIYNLMDNTKKHRKLYQIINENGGFSNWKFTCLESLTCKRKEARIKEEFFYDKLEADLNMNRPYASKEDKRSSKLKYNFENKDKIAEQIKLYNTKNKDVIIEYQKKYQIENKNKLSEQDKQKYVKNKDKISERTKQYALLNKEKLALQKSEKIFCEPCGFHHSRGGKAYHYKTKNHLANIANFTGL